MLVLLIWRLLLKKGYILPGFDEIQVDLIHKESETYVGFNFHRLTEFYSFEI
jgi:hypothetical protein